MSRIFISYSTKDGKTFAAELRQMLEQGGFSIWQDVIALEGGRDWWSQIEGVLRSKELEHFVLVVTPGALASPVVRREIHLARQEGKTVSPVKGPGLDDLAELPRWLGQIYDLTIPEKRKVCLNVLALPGKTNRVPMMAPEPPVDFIKRPKEFNALKQRLLDSKGDAIAITAALKGAGGYGKTTLAKALAHDPDIQDAYFDGVLWIELGEKPDNMLALISDLIVRLTGVPANLQTIGAVTSALGDALGNRRILFVVDDVWRDQDLTPFLHGGEHTTRLITTRLDQVVPEQAFRQPVDSMRETEAIGLLAQGLQEEAPALRAELKALAARLGQWALLLKLANGFLRQRVRGRESLADAIMGANRRLDAKGLTVFDARKEADRSKAVARTIGVNLERLTADQRDRFVELGIFPEDEDVPVEIAAHLWRETGGLDDIDSESLLSELLDLSLLLELDFDRRTFRLHDTIRHFLREQVGTDVLAVHHKQLLKALDDKEWAAQAGDCALRYSYLYRPLHLAGAGEWALLDALLTDPAWIESKLRMTSVLPLVGDYDNFARQTAAKLIGQALRLSSGIIARDPRLLMTQLFFRLAESRAEDLPSFLEAVRQRFAPSCIQPRRLGLTPPGGAETTRLEGHEHFVTALTVLPDGRLASGSWDNTIRLWDVNSGVEVGRLVGHDGYVTALTVLTDGRLASGSADGTMRLWDVDDRTETACLEASAYSGDASNGRGRGVNALAVLPDGSLASGSWDHIIRLWDVASGAETSRLTGHEGGVNALAVLPNSRLASASDDKTIRFWDVASGAEIARLQGHDREITALAALPDGRLASCSYDQTIRLWDVASATEIACLRNDVLEQYTALALLRDGRLASAHRGSRISVWDVVKGTDTAHLQGHGSVVWALTVLPDGRLASASWDHTIRLWDTAKGTRLDGHGGGINALAVLPNGRLASGSWDTTIGLWDVANGREAARLKGHGTPVLSLAALADGGLASGCWDATIRLWDAVSGTETACLKGHTERIWALAVLPDGRLASGSFDRSIRLWDLASGAETACLKGHADVVWALAALPDGRLASASADNTIRLWDIASGTETACLKGHTERICALTVLADGRLASGSRDQTIRLWDVASGAETACLEGHASVVRVLTGLPDGRLASGSEDNTIRLWDIASGTEIARLEVDNHVSSLAILSGNRLVAGDGIGRLHWLDVRPSN